MRPESPSPTPTDARIVALDVLRGVALLGICAVHMPHFGLVDSGATEAPQQLGGAAMVATWITHALFLSRSFPLFATLFGAGLILQMQRIERAGGDFTRIYRRRLVWLGTFGVLHGTLLFSGDVLFLYSLCGALLFLCRRLPPRTLLIGSAVLLALGAVLGVVLQDPSSPSPSTTLDQPTWDEHEDITLQQIAGARDEQWDAFERKAYGEGPLRSTLLVNTASYLVWLLYGAMSSYDARVLAFFVLGAALMKLRAFDRTNERHHRLAGLVGLGIGVPVSAAAPWLRSGTDSGALPALVSGLGSLLVVAGYLGGFTWLANRAPRALPVRMLAAAGRLALTNYLLQSVLGNLLFRWFGFDLFEQLDHAELFAIAVAMFSCQALFSLLWLARWRMGPMEWIWRRLTYGDPRLRR